jgi:hypothetical protein
VSRLKEPFLSGEFPMMTPQQTYEIEQIIAEGQERRFPRLMVAIALLSFLEKNDLDMPQIVEDYLTLGQVMPPRSQFH